MISIRNIKNWALPRWAYWLLFTVTGLLILIFEDEWEDQDSYAITIVIYFLLLFLVMAHWIFSQIRLVIKLKNEKKKTELVHLQNQVNPHFFFNTLNNLYGWVEKDPKQAQAMILKLSDLMRYSIYDGQKNFVTLEEEVQYLKHYIELHKMRYLKKIDISLSVDIQGKAPHVRPLLFIILLENAFKHGVENLRENAFVNIDISAYRNEVSFFIENNFDGEGETENVGIGLKNLKRRLELVYPKKHTLDLSKKENTFMATLTLNLA